MITSTHTNVAKPVPSENKANTAPPISISRTRLWLSAIWAIGTVSDSPSRAATATSDRIPASVMWKASRMFGTSRPNESRSISSTMLNPNRMTSA